MAAEFNPSPLTDVDRLSTFQKELHLPANPSLGPDHLQNSLGTPFLRKLQKVARYVHWLEKLPVRQKDEQTTTYRVNSQRKGLLSATLSSRLPSITFQEGYAGRWIYNVGSNQIVSLKWLIDEGLIQSFDGISLDQFNQTSAVDRESLALDLGNLPSLQDFHSTLPAYSTVVSLPLEFGQRDLTESGARETDSPYFPLSLFGKNNSIEFDAVLRRKLPELIQVIRLSDSTLAPVDATTIATVDGKVYTDRYQLSLPEMYGDYVHPSEEECKMNQCLLKADDKYVMYIPQTAIFTSINPVAGGKTESISIKGIDYPIHQLAWVAVNCQSRSRGEYSNYSTSSQRAALGWSPILSTTIHTGKEILLSEIPAVFTERVHPRKYFPAVPSDPGLNYWRMGLPSARYAHPPGIVFRNGHLNVTLRPGDETYLVEVRATYLRKIVLTKFPLNEEERLSKTTVCTVEKP